MRSSVERLLLVGAIVCVASHSSAQEQSLVVTARGNGGSASVVIDTCGPLSTVESIVGPSSLIVRGMVRSATAKLSPDETLVVTEYELIPFRLFKGSVPPLDRPGAQPPIRFTIPFGTLDIDGLHLSTSVNVFPAAEMPRPGEEIVVFLYLRPDWHTYALWGGDLAAFRVTDGMVVGLTRGARDRRGDKPEPVAQFEQRLLAALSK
jgi:hypothetical protein